MAINQRPDTPLAATPDPSVDPIIKRTTTTNPSEGTTTYRQSWNTSGQKKSSTAVKSSTKSTGAPSKTVAKTKTPSSREFTTFKSPTAAGPTKDMNINTPAIKSRESFVPKARTEIIASNKVKDYNKNKSEGEDFTQYRKRIQDRANKVAADTKSKSSSGGRFSNDKQRSGSCSTCN